MFRDWSVMVQATLAQALRFELVHEARPEEDRAIVDTWFKVLRVRAQQNSVEAKHAKQRQRQLEAESRDTAEPVPADVPVEAAATPFVFPGSEADEARTRPAEQGEPPVA